jgi:hypothetical protein
VFDGLWPASSSCTVDINLFRTMLLQGRTICPSQHASTSRCRPLQQHLCQVPVHCPSRASRRVVKRQSNKNGNLHGHGLGPSTSTWEGLNQALADEFLQAIKAPQVSEPKVFVFVRHGHSTWNQQSRIQVSSPRTAGPDAATASTGCLLHMTMRGLTRHLPEADFRIRFGNTNQSVVVVF